ncbi:hypothetical protein [Photorhabdus bodei]|uniref:Uncharacterized protein n=1 Tax=Photorhabdus bodei TaxID=2029681 RepID=A0ABX0AVZ9_9GAMM|nr:hypothetical protein [Photorhabdus bodei]NDL01562.1 hypothetical protein [Photorhabdus bodei]NDL05821.1 hypothetical protein [Photorhabdus bodei]NDL10065.1 hypothetical protein [Photorhabdus bodei]
MQSRVSVAAKSVTGRENPTIILDGANYTIRQCVFFAHSLTHQSYYGDSGGAAFWLAGIIQAGFSPPFELPPRT